MQFTHPQQVSLVSLAFVLLSFFGCNPNGHNTSTHPCNFPDDETGANLRSPFSFKILDKESFKNKVDTILSNDFIHPDSVLLYTDSFEEINPSPRFRFDKEWIFDNFPPYTDVPFNDAQALLNLTNKIFYLQTSNNDLDTIEVKFNSCLVSEVTFNQRPTALPEGVQSSAGFYFLK